MSGFAGIYHLNNSLAELSDVRRMLATIAHRGPDGSSFWCEGPLAVGNCLLFTTAESMHESMPVTDADKRYVLVGDLRIDNRREIGDALGIMPGDLNGRGDGFLVLESYKRWGVECAEHLLGDFAFAIWDRRTKRLFCTRDHFGIKPFYYHYVPSTLFAFASEPKALLQLSGITREVDEVEVARLFCLPLADDGGSTLYRDVRRLPASNTCSVDAEGCRFTQYWAPDPAKEFILGSDGEYAEAFREHFIEAVRCRIRSAMPIGSMLSGGLDSSSVTSVAAHLGAGSNGKGLRVYSAVFDTVSESDERNYIQSVVARHKLQPHYFHADRVSPLAEWEDMLWHLDGTNNTGNLYLNWNLYKAASNHNIRVMLDGFDGDTTVSHGAGYFHELAASGRWLTLGREVSALSQRMGGSRIAPVWAWVRRYGLHPLYERIIRRQRSNGDSHERSDLLDAQHFAPLNRNLEMRLGHLEAERIEQPRTERQNHFQLLTRPLMTRTVELLDGCASAFGIEIRYPFFDKRLVELCLSLPPEQKLRRGWSRLVMRRAMEGLLPSDVQWRPGKSNLQPSFDQGLLAFEQDSLGRILGQNTGGIDRFIDVPYFSHVLDRYVSGRAGRRDKVLLWRAISLALWLNLSDQQRATGEPAAERLDVKCLSNSA